MSPTRLFNFIIPIVALAACLLGTKSWGKPPIAKPNTKEIRVTLFGQPCQLQGSLDESVLKLIHSVSPAQLYPSHAQSSPNEAKNNTRRALEKLRSLRGLPPELDRYRDRLARRLEAQTAFFDGIEASRSSHKAEPLLSLTKRYIAEKSDKKFEALAKKIESKPANIAELTEQLLDLYNDGIEPDPEEEFHRAIRRLKVEYVCSFDDVEEDEQE
jgi:predicted RNase H-like nuclease (RuvC/YqgF family)